MTKQGEFYPATCSPATNAIDSPVRCYLRMEGRVTVRQLRDHLAAHYPHADFDDVALNFGTAVWERPANPREIEQRKEWQRSQAERTETWERKKYAELKAKYEPTPPPAQDTPPDRSGRWVDGQLVPFGPRDLDGWQPTHPDTVAGD